MMKNNTFRTELWLDDGESTQSRGQDIFIPSAPTQDWNRTAILVHLGVRYKMQISPS